jgi:hypothetical protein
MIEQTIQEAAQLVEEVPVSDVFNWRRLIWQGVWVLIVTVGFFLLSWFGYSMIAAGSATLFNQKEFNPGAASSEFLGDFPDLSGDWFDRDVLLNNLVWQRHCYLVFLEPEGSEYKIGRDVGSVNMRVHAYQYVIADAGEKEGMRPLKWDDRKRVLGDRAADVQLPEEWGTPDQLTMDQILLLLDRDSGTIEDSTRRTLRTLFQYLDEETAKPSNKRKLRKLDIPKTVRVFSKGSNTRTEMTLQKQENNEFTGKLDNLTEIGRYHYYAHGEDYDTPSRYILVVPPPSIIELQRDQFWPAYQFFRLPPGSPEDLAERQRTLAGLKVVERGLGVSVDKSVFDVPVGTDVVLTAKTDK